MIIITSSVSLLVLIIIIIAIVLIITHGRLRKRIDHYIPLLVDGCKQVFIINSPQSNEEDLCLVRRLCHKLADHSIEAVNFEYSTFDRQHGPGHSGIYQWTENNFTKCDMILFVCNKNFYNAWNNGDTDHNSLISASKLLLQGHLSNSEDLSQFGIILLRQSDDQYIPSLYLRSLQKFLVFQNDQCVVDNLLDRIHQYEN